MRIASLLAAAVLVLTACGTQTDAGAPDASGAPDSGDTVDYGFSGTTLDGETFDGATLEGKPAVLWFWAPWCPTCRAQIPNVTQLADKYAGEVAVIAVGGLDSEDAIRELAEEIPNVTHLVDDEGEVWQHFKVSAQSTYTVIGADGRIESEGYLDDAQLNALVDQLAG